jgi:hypothetical protein
MAEDTLWEQGWQLKEIQNELLEIRKYMKDIPELKSSMNQLMGMVTSLLAKEKQREKQPIHLEEDVAVAGCGVLSSGEDNLEENQQALKGFTPRL